MGGFILYRAQPHNEQQIADLSESLKLAREIGYEPPVTLTHGDFRLRLYGKIGGNQAPSLVEYPNGDFICATGTLIFRGSCATAALPQIFAQYRGDPALLDEAQGHFALIIKKAGTLHLICDRFGGYGVYCSSDLDVVSSAFLGASRLQPSLRLSSQSIYEYVFDGVVSGDETLFEEIKLLPLMGVLEIRNDRAVLRRRPYVLPNQPLPKDWDVCTERTLGLLQDQIAALVRVFGDKISSALSGGYDSRLLLALLRQEGITPRLYVYGKPEDSDVRVARAIAAGEQLRLEVIDKDATAPIDPADFPSIVRRNLIANDGCLWGGVFNNAAELNERKRRVADGAVALNGGGGEILRNFFYLRDGSYSVRQLLWSFYGQFDPSECTDNFEEEAYFRNLEAKIGALVGMGRTRLARTIVEWLYHNFRCRSWDGRVNTVNSRYGHTALPFLDRHLTEWASRIPLSFKNHGAFEANLICRIDPRLAAYPSNYGHDFSGRPPLTRVLKDLSTHLRPTPLRRFSFRLKHRTGKGSPRSGYLAEPYVAAALPNGIETMRRFFRVDRVYNEEHYNRILSLEYLTQYFGSKLRP